MCGHVVFEHPASFHTLALEAKTKKDIMNNLITLSKAKDYYAKLDITIVHPKCRTLPCPLNEENPPDSRTGAPKLLGAECRMTPKISNEDTR
ncbi:hypothetical protein AgCh_005103 [Apium graveolens]